MKLFNLIKIVSFVTLVNLESPEMVAITVIVEMIV